MVQITIKMNKTKLNKLYRSRKTILEILEDQGIKIPDEDKLEYKDFEVWAADDDEETIKDAMTLKYKMKKKNEKEDIMVFWLKDQKLGVNMRNIYAKMVKKECKNAIVVVDQSITHYAKAIIRNLKHINVYVSCYTLKESMINISKHRWVPHHSICTDKEKQRVKKVYSVSNKQLPGIKTTDPMARHLDARKGQLIRIIRNSDTQKGLKSIYYRIVT